jgi:adenylate kinase family enzyme
MNEMQRIMIIGNAGSGKSTLGRELAARLKLPLHHLDKLFWKPGWQKPDPDVFDESLYKIMAEEKWIIEGNYSRTLQHRAARADTIIFLSISTPVCLYRVIRRRFANTPREDIPADCPERLDMAFLNWVIFYKRRSADSVRTLLKSFSGKNIIELKSGKEVRNFLNGLSN